MEDGEFLFLVKNGNIVKGYFVKLHGGAYGEWQMAYGRWHMAYSEWRMAYGEWRMADRRSGLGIEYSFLEF